LKKPFWDKNTIILAIILFFIICAFVVGGWFFVNTLNDNASNEKDIEANMEYEKYDYGILEE
jgi:hypothetical protein